MALILTATALPAPAAATTVTFLRVDQNDEAVKEADRRLERLLERELGTLPGGRLDSESFSYERAIHELASWSRRQGAPPYLARVTPYVYVAAEMLGADFEVFGTYERPVKRGEGPEGTATTYRAHFVVRRGDFPEASEDSPPDLADLRRFLEERAADGAPAHFVYHSRLSTSSYFLPTLYFHQHRIFAMPQSTGGLTAIRSQHLDMEKPSSTELVTAVIGREADLAAVWDGTRDKFAPGGTREVEGQEVFFIELPTRLPNDLLVGSSFLPNGVRRELRELLREQRPEINHDDVLRWVDIREAPEAHAALTDLRRSARESRMPATVSIHAADDGHLQAARLAVRLSGDEMVLHDDLHRNEDYVWTLRRVRDGHLKLESEIAGSKLRQTFHISFQPGDSEDLTLRIRQIIESRLHRIRYVWLYDDASPLVIRDVPFSLATDSQIEMHKIIWSDPEHNDYTRDGTYRVRIEHADLYKFRLAPEDVARLASSLDPMSNVAYRVILVRPEEPQRMLYLLTTVLYSLIALSIGATVLACRRPRPARARSHLSLEPAPAGNAARG